jgi:tetratricopeptide (TPR) repeat protein
MFVYMKKITIFTCFIIITLIAFGQGAIDPNMNFSTISKVHSRLLVATGWAMMDNGNWQSASNKIPFTTAKINKNETEKIKLGEDNFIAFELLKVLIQNKQYNILIKKYHDGEFEFPMLNEGWRKFQSFTYYVFESGQLAKVLPEDVVFNNPYAVNLNVFCSGNVRDYNPKLINSYIAEKIRKTLNTTSINTVNLIFAVFPVKTQSEQIVRFKLIQSYSKKSLYDFYMSSMNKFKLFSSTYYSVNYHVFKSFIRNTQVFNIPASVDPNDFASYLSWGILKYQTGNYIGAIEDLQKAVKLNSDTNVSILYSYLGNAKSKLEDYNGAIEDFDRAIDIKPTDVMDYANWIKNYYNRGVTKFYLNDLRGACSDWKIALELGFGLAYDFYNQYCKK